MAVYTLPDLDYDYSALAPHISGEIMELHHSKHHAAYVAGANQALEQLRRVLARRSYAGLLRVLSRETRDAIERDLRGLGLSTVCEEARCPNIGECWGGEGGKEQLQDLALGWAAGSTSMYFQKSRTKMLRL